MSRNHLRLYTSNNWNHCQLFYCDSWRLVAWPLTQVGMSRLWWRLTITLTRANNQRRQITAVRQGTKWLTILDPNRMKMSNRISDLLWSFIKSSIYWARIQLSEPTVVHQFWFKGSRYRTSFAFRPPSCCHVQLQKDLSCIYLPTSAISSWPT